MGRRMSPPRIQNLDINAVNQALIEIYRNLNEIANSADEITFREGKSGAKELVINDNGRKYTDSSKASFTSGTTSDDVEVDTIKINKKIIGTSAANKFTFSSASTLGPQFYSDNSKFNFHTGTSGEFLISGNSISLTNAGSTNSFISLLALAPYDSFIKFYSGTSQKWKIGNDPTIGVTADQNDFKIEAGTGTSFADSSQFRLNSDGDLTISGDLKAAETAAGSETAKIAVLDSGVIKYRTAVQMQAEVSANVHIMTHNFDCAGTAAVYIPFGGSQIESAFTTDALDDDTRFIAPFDGKLIRLIFQSASAGAATNALLRVNGTDGSGMTSTPIAAANTTTTLTINSSSNSFSAGDRLRVKFDPTNAPDEITMTSVWEFTKT